MMMKKVFSTCLVVVAVVGLSACDNTKAVQEGPLSFGASDGAIENTYCSVFHERNNVADVATNNSETSVWVTNVQPVNAKHWKSMSSMASVLPDGTASLLAWTNEDLTNPDVQEVAENLRPLDGPLEVPAGGVVQVSVDGEIESGVEDAEVSQLQITYKKDVDSKKSFTVRGNVRYEWKSERCA